MGLALDMVQLQLLFHGGLESMLNFNRLAKQCTGEDSLVSAVKAIGYMDQKKRREFPHLFQQYNEQHSNNQSEESVSDENAPITSATTSYDLNPNTFTATSSDLSPNTSTVTSSDLTLNTSTVTSSDLTPTTSAVTPSDLTPNTFTATPSDLTLNTSAVTPSDLTLNTSTVTSSDLTLNTSAVTPSDLTPNTSTATSSDLNPSTPIATARSTTAKNRTMLQKEIPETIQYFCRELKGLTQASIHGNGKIYIPLRPRSQFNKLTQHENPNKEETNVKMFSKRNGLKQKGRLPKNKNMQNCIHSKPVVNRTGRINYCRNSQRPLQSIESIHESERKHLMLEIAAGSCIESFMKSLYMIMMPTQVEINEKKIPKRVMEISEISVGTEETPCNYTCELIDALKVKIRRF